MSYAVTPTLSVEAVQETVTLQPLTHAAAPVGADGATRSFTFSKVSTSCGRFATVPCSIDQTYRLSVPLPVIPKVCVVPSRPLSTGAESVVENGVLGAVAPEIVPSSAPL